MCSPRIDLLSLQRLSGFFDSCSEEGQHDIGANEWSLSRFFCGNPWGRRRNGTNWLDYENINTPFTSLYKRGYTGHEHIDAFGLINMNGRMYDPRLGRFLSPDPFVQAPNYTQSYNRYSYVWNNPMKYVDPTGYTAQEPNAIIITDPEQIRQVWKWLTGSGSESSIGEIWSVLSGFLVSHA
jgi:RHS repeat-associated protein